jgi:hypothetical protein
MTICSLPALRAIQQIVMRVAIRHATESGSPDRQPGCAARPFGSEGDLLKLEGISEQNY